MAGDQCPGCPPRCDQSPGYTGPCLSSRTLLAFHRDLSGTIFTLVRDATGSARYLMRCVASRLRSGDQPRLPDRLDTLAAAATFAGWQAPDYSGLTVSADLLATASPPILASSTHAVHAAAFAPQHAVQRHALPQAKIGS